MEGGVSLRTRLLRILMKGHAEISRACNDDQDVIACGDGSAWIDDAAARAWGALAASAYNEGNDFCSQLSPYHAALRSHSGNMYSTSWLICPASWLTLTIMMRTWALDFPPTRSMLCHTAWSPMFDILLPPSSAVFAKTAASAAGDGGAGADAARTRAPRRRVLPPRPAR